MWRCNNCGQWVYGNHTCLDSGGAVGLAANYPMWTYPPTYQFLEFDNNYKYYWILNTIDGQVYKKEVIESKKGK